MVADGYKQTEIGLIPNEWKIESIGNICQINGRIGFRGYTVNDIVSSDKGAITISPSNIQDGKTLFDKCTYLSWHKYYESPEIKIYNGDILLVKTGSTVGKTALVKNLKEKATLNPQLVVLKKINIDNIYLSYVSSYKLFQDQIQKTVVGGAIPTLSQKQVAGFTFPIPKKYEEQKAIATALSDVDELITTLTTLIAKKEDIKTATMQQLLTGKKRLDGFSGEWEEKKLGDIVDVVSGGTPSTTIAGYWNGTIDWYTPTEVGKDKYISQSNRKLTEEGFQNSSAKILPIGTILFTSRAGIGDTSILMSEGCTNQGFQSLVVKKNIDNEFVYYLISTLTNKFLQNASGSTFLEISPNQVRLIDITIPKYQEQQAIATILSDIDKELEILKTKLEKTKAIKTGMMQELLTGKTRLI